MWRLWRFFRDFLRIDQEVRTLEEFCEALKIQGYKKYFTYNEIECRTIGLQNEHEIYYIVITSVAITKSNIAIAFRSRLVHVFDPKKLHSDETMVKAKDAVKKRQAAIKLYLSQD